MKDIVLGLLLSSATAFAQSETPAAVAQLQAPHGDPPWTLAWPTPKEITLPQIIPGSRCESESSGAKKVDLSKIDPTIAQYHVMTDGHVQDVRITETSGNDSLDQYMVTCVKQWRYTPATYDGVVVPVTREIRVIWRDGPSPPPK